MSAFKRKRGGRGPVNKKAKKVKIVVDEGEATRETEEEKKNEVTIPAPVSSVRVQACY